MLSHDDYAPGQEDRDIPDVGWNSASWTPPFPPEPCQYCSMMSRVLMEHDGRCDGLTKERWEYLIRDESAKP